MGLPCRPRNHGKPLIKASAESTPSCKSRRNGGWRSRQHRRCHSWGGRGRHVQEQQLLCQARHRSAACQEAIHGKPAGCTAVRSVPWPGQASVDKRCMLLWQRLNARRDPAMPTQVMLCRTSMTTTPTHSAVALHCVSCCLAFCCTLLSASRHPSAASGSAWLSAGQQHLAKTGGTAVTRA